MARTNNPKLTLITGGARSGKSAFAEALVEGMASLRVYIATAHPADDEMSRRIAAHQARRAKGWVTREMDEIGEIDWSGIREDAAILFDCMTLWLGFRYGDDFDATSEVETLLTQFEALPNPVVVVSNELGMGLVPENAMSRGFRDAHGAINQSIAARADAAAFVVSGLPMVLKGTLP
jgi:adenosylcobinamide kinase/adenosylcobinamide-phosphate guanylyltransferase